MILAKERDPRLVTVRRGGTLSDDDHRLLAAWAVAADAGPVAGVAERERQRDRLPSEVRALVLDDQRHRDPICWGVFGA